MKTAEAKPASKQASRTEQSFFNKGGRGMLSNTSVNEHGSFISAKQKPFFSNNKPIQAKLAIGSPNDKYEREADHVADKVVQRLSKNETAQPQIKTGIQPKTVQPKRIAPVASITPMVQAKCANCEQEEKLQKKEEEKETESMHGKLQKKPIFDSNAEPPDDEKNIQRKCAECEKEEKLQKRESDKAAGTVNEQIQLKPIFESNNKAEEQVQRKCAECEKEEHLQKKNSDSSSQTAPPSVESTLSASKGSGSPLPESTRSQMESSIGADFSGVRIHNNSAAAQLSDNLNAQAFTHGNDIYFNSGKYDTNSSEGNHLLAHELTHTVQQGASENKKQEFSKTNQKNIQRNIFGDAWDAAGDLASDVGDVASDVGSSIASGAKYVGGKVWSGAKAVGSAIYDAGAAGIKFLVNELAPGLLDFLGNAFEFIKDKIVEGIDSLTGGLFSKIQSKGLADILLELLGSGFSSIGSLISSGCSAIASVCHKLYTFAKKLLGPALAAFKKVMHAIGGFFSSLWDDIGKPAWDAIKKYGGAALDWIIAKAKWVWNLIEPIRNAVARAWNWIKEQFGIAWSEGGSVLDWIKEKASAAWDWVKAKIQPIIGPLKIIGGILLMLSPAGPIIAIWYGAPVIWKAIKWLAENFNKYVILKAKDFFYNQILLAIKSGLSRIQSLIGSAMEWVHDAFTSLGFSIKSLLTSLSNFALFRVIGNGIKRVASGIQNGISFVANKAVNFGKWVASTASRIWNFLEPIREILRNFLVMGVLGPLAILDDGVWSMLESIVRFSMKVPCIRELEGLLQVPFWMEKISGVRQTLKDMWFMITHPDILEAKAKAFLEPYMKDIAGKSESVLTKALATVGLATTKHISGILKYLLPAITKLLSNWWPEVKKMIWYLVWPFAEGSPLYTDGPKLWKLVPQIWANFWHGDFKMARDGFLEWMQALNNVVGIFAGWIAIGGALIGAIVGAFAGGVGAIPGAGVGFQIALEIGEGIMISMMATETAVLAVGVSDLLSVSDDENSSQKSKPTQNTNTSPDASTIAAANKTESGSFNSDDIHSGHDRIEYAYQRIGNSSLTLGIMGAMMLLGAVGGEIAKGLMSIAKTISEVVGERLPALGEFVGDVGNAFKESKLGKTLDEARNQFDAGRKIVREKGKLVPENSPETKGINDDVSTLENKVTDPTNIKKVTEPEFANEYDVEVEVGEHRFRRKKSNHDVWCRFSDPVCLIGEMDDVNVKVDQGFGETAEAVTPESETTKIDASEVTQEKPNPGKPGSLEHRAQRWKEYQERTSPDKRWSQQRWDRQYDINMQQARKANAAVDRYQSTLDWQVNSEREVRVEIEGIERRFDIMETEAITPDLKKDGIIHLEDLEKAGIKPRAVEYKSGKIYNREEIQWEVARDEILVKEKGWKITWVFEEQPSGPLLDNLKNAGIEVEVLKL